MRTVRVLIIDDEPAITRSLRPALQGHDYEIATAATGAAGLQQVAALHPDLILLDLGLPDIDGQALLGEIRQQTTVPVIVLSVRGADRDKIRALDNGANDYLTKPFSIGELLARLRVARRATLPVSTAKGAPALLGAGDMLLDPQGHTMTIRNAPVHLSPTQFALLELLMRNAGKVVTHQTLLHTIWGPEYVGETPLLRVNISQLRGKIEDQPERPAYIITEPGVGYRFRELAE